MSRLKDFLLEFIQSVMSDAESRGLMTVQSFLETACEVLVEAGDLTPDYAIAEYVKADAESAGYDYDPARNILTLFNCLFFQEEEIQTLTKGQLASKFTKLKYFYKRSAEGFYRSMEETSDSYSMAYNVYRYAKGQLARVRFLLVTDGRLTKNVSVLNPETIDGIQFEFRVIDIEYLRSIYASGTGSAAFEVKADLPCLKAADHTRHYQSYLSIVTGNQLVKMYEEHGQRLFEQNVRTFLQFKGGVNKGMRSTIQYHPEMFFAFNNGITATAGAIEFAKNGNIQSIKNFQIVNGGQTVSAIYAAARKSGLDVSAVSVQMKLSVVKKLEDQDNFVSKVAEYANTQNKVNNSDFFSNHPFHKQLKILSAAVFAPAAAGSQRRTRWYYERVRGEYLNSQAYLDRSEKRKFQLDYPKSQVIDKTLLAKTENVWRQVPHIVSKGAQYSFKDFSNYIIEMIDKHGFAVTDTYFKRAVARVILFRTVERIITRAQWYDGGYRAQTAAYGVAKLSSFLESAGYRLNINFIWETQSIPTALVRLLEMIAAKVYEVITSPVEGKANPAQYAKTLVCWENVFKIDLTFNNWDSSIFISSSQSPPVESLPLPQNSAVYAQLSKIDASEWMLLLDKYNEAAPDRSLTSQQRQLLTQMAHGLLAEPTESQSNTLYELYIGFK
jgi:hypothetical protein